MNNPLINYLHQQTLPAPLAIVPKQAQETAPEPDVIMAARFLGMETAYRRDGTSYQRERWSSAKFRVTGYYTRLEDNLGVYVVNSERVRVEAESKVAKIA